MRFVTHQGQRREQKAEQAHWNDGVSDAGLRKNNKVILEKRKEMIDGCDDYFKVSYIISNKFSIFQGLFSYPEEEVVYRHDWCHP